MSRKETYERFKSSPKGVLCRIYSEQQGKSKEKARYLLSYTRQEFYDRFLNDPHYLRLHGEWVESGCQRAKVPSIDRIDPSKGYSMDNIQMVTWSENHTKSLKEHTHTAVVVYDKQGNLLGDYNSMKEASAATGATPSSIYGVCIGRWGHAKGFVFRYRGDAFRTEKARQKSSDLKSWRDNLKKPKTLGVGHFKINVFVFRWGKFIGEYESIKAVKVELGVNPTSNGKKILDTGHKTGSGYQLFSSMEKAKQYYESPDILRARAEGGGE